MQRTHEEALTIGWTSGNVSHAVIRADNGTLYRACYYLYDLDGSPLADEPNPGRLCRRASCRVEFAAWTKLRARPSPNAAKARTSVVTALLVVLLTAAALGPTAAQADPEPAQQPAFLVGASSKRNAVAALDDNGRAIGQGKGFGRTVAMALCPGAARSVEIDDDGGELSLVVRSLPTLSVVKQRSVDRLEGQFTVSCGSASGTDVFGFVQSSGSPDRLVRLDPDGAWSGVWNGEAFAGAFSPDGRTAYVAAGPLPEVKVVSIGLSIEQTEEIGVVSHEPSALSVSPDGSKLAVFAPVRQEGQQARAWVFPVAGGPPVDRPPTPGPGMLRAMTWSAEDRLTFEHRQDDGGISVETHDAGLTRLGQWAGWDVTSTVSRGGALYGLSSGGRLVKADPIAGEIGELQKVDGAGMLVAVPIASVEKTPVHDIGLDEAQPEGSTARSAVLDGKRSMRLGALIGTLTALAAGAVVVARRRRSRAR